MDFPVVLRRCQRLNELESKESLTERMIMGLGNFVTQGTVNLDAWTDQMNQPEIALTNGIPLLHILEAMIVHRREVHITSEID
jgi:hypothetical protein